MLRARQDVSLKPNKNANRTDRNGNQKMKDDLVNSLVRGSKTKIRPDNKHLDRQRTTSFLRLSGLKSKYIGLFQNDYEEMKKMDLNGDGDISEEELIEYYIFEKGLSEEDAKVKAKEMLDKYDNNGDHKLDLEEIRSTIRTRLLEHELIVDKNWIEKHHEEQRKLHERRLEDRKRRAKMKKKEGLRKKAQKKES